MKYVAKTVPGSGICDFEGMERSWKDLAYLIKRTRHVILKLIKDVRIKKDGYCVREVGIYMP